MTVVQQPVADDREARFEQAKKHAEALQGFLSHLIVYVVVNAMLFLVNLFTRGQGGPWWFYWPLLGWGVALAIHAATFALPVFSPDWAERRARRMLDGREP